VTNVDGGAFPRPSGLDVDAAARLAGQVQEFGFDSARLVVGRFAEMFDRFQSSTARSGSAGPLSWVSGPMAQNPSDEPDALLLAHVEPGGRCAARMWMHNPTNSSVSNLRFWSQGFVTHDGKTLPPSAITFNPPNVPSIEPESSLEVTVSVAIPSATLPGTYHGQILVEGLPEEVFPARVNVVDPAVR